MAHGGKQSLTCASKGHWEQYDPCKQQAGHAQNDVEWSGCKSFQCVVGQILGRAFVASMQAKQLHALSLFPSALHAIKTREQHAFTLDGGGRGLPPLALSMVQLEDGLPV